MKKILFTVCMVLLASAGFAQLTLEQRYDSVDDFQVVNLAGYGQKYLMSKAAGKEIRLYNDDHSVFKTISVNLPAGASPIYNVFWAATKFVDNDNMVEVGFSYYVGMTPRGAIVKEDGTMLYTLDSVYEMHPVNVNGDWKLLAMSTSYITLVYDVSGAYMPVKAVDGSTGEVASMLYPNPMSNAATLKYTLPDGVTDGVLEVYNMNGQKLRSYQVDGQFSSVLIQRGELPGGTYIYQLKAGDNAPVAKRFVIN